MIFPLLSISAIISSNNYNNDSSWNDNLMTYDESDGLDHRFPLSLMNDTHNIPELSLSYAMSLIPEFRELNSKMNASTTTTATSSNNGSILLTTLRLYGSMYLVCLALHAVLRRFHPKLFNIRSWVPHLQCALAVATAEGTESNQFPIYDPRRYKIRDVSDEELFEQCGMDSLCFLRALRFGRRLSLLGCLNATYLIPLYVTATIEGQSLNDGKETVVVVTDLLTRMSLSNLPSSSARFIGPVVAVYLSYLYTMHLIIQEFVWYRSWRDKFLSQKKPQNYACYVSGIPPEYQSSFKLLEYFRQCATGLGTSDRGSAVLEAHVAYDTPRLDKYVARREAVVQNLEHAVLLEKLTGNKTTHISYEVSWPRRLRTRQNDEDLPNSNYHRKCATTRGKVSFSDSFSSAGVNFTDNPNAVGANSNVRTVQESRRLLQRVESIGAYQNELDYLNRKIQRSIHEITKANDQYRSQFTKFRPSRNLLHGIVLSDDENDVENSDGGDEEEQQEHNKLLERMDDNKFSSNPLLGNASRIQIRRNLQLQNRFTKPGQCQYNYQQQNHFRRPSQFPNTANQAVLEEIPEIESPDTNSLSSPSSFPPSPALVSSVESPLPASEEIVFLEMPCDTKKGMDGSTINPNYHKHGNHDRNDYDDIESFPMLSSASSSSSSSDDKENDECDNKGKTKTDISISSKSPIAQKCSFTDINQPQSPCNKNIITRRKGLESNNLCRSPLLMDTYRSLQGFFRERDITSSLSTSSDVGASGVGTVATATVCDDARENIQAITQDKTYTAEKVQAPMSNQITVKSETSIPSCVTASPLTESQPSTSSGCSYLTIVEDSLIGIREGSSSSRNSRASSSAWSQSSSSPNRTSVARIKSATQDATKSITLKTLAITTSATVSIGNGSRVAGQSIVEFSRKTGETLTKVSKDLHADKFVQCAGEHLGKTTEQAKQVGSELISTAGAVVPILLSKTEGQPKDAGFVVFTNLYTTQTAIQMVHHPTPYVMDVVEAPDPDDIFWRNVGLPQSALRGGRIASIVATATLCLFWTVPTGVISSLTEINSLKESLPKFGSWIDRHPFLEQAMAQLAPLLLTILTEVILPEVLLYFATWEGHISSSMLQASLFVKLGVFMIIQTFFVSAISGSVSAQIANMLDDPEVIVDLLAVSLPAQSTYFMQLALVSTFFLQSMEVLRVYPLSLALLRRFFGPNLTPRERQQKWWFLCPLEDPPDFRHAETFAQLILFYMVTFVYQPIAPITSFLLYFCFTIVEIGYRYQLIHNYPNKVDSGGRLWIYWMHFTLASMVIAQLTLIGLLSLKQSKYSGPVLGPLLGITVLFIFFINSKHKWICEYLPTCVCVAVDRERSSSDSVGNHIMDTSFVTNKYLQPSLRTKIVHPNFDEGIDYYTMKRSTIDSFETTAEQVVTAESTIRRTISYKNNENTMEILKHQGVS